ncbi:hypothetical protein E3E12_07025 [Formicincola oecophyllae]|uniref:Apea-like HEPN domain-containing protein n=1 Tax=Formicincola oecophyllae TaxID=2558361 RepID=A0A4Y6U935_9PROT|nr:hypothetical protein [Formicincola oecophyllae]QDH13969.1 hypothetical protein E3E12_07025 [Formicincola oecophyllae]
MIFFSIEKGKFNWIKEINSENIYDIGSQIIAVLKQKNIYIILFPGKGSLDKGGINYSSLKFTSKAAFIFESNCDILSIEELKLTKFTPCESLNIKWDLREYLKLYINNTSDKVTSFFKTTNSIYNNYIVINFEGEFDGNQPKCEDVIIKKLFLNMLLKEEFKKFSTLHNIDYLISLINQTEWFFLTAISSLHRLPYPVIKINKPFPEALFVYPRDNFSLTKPGKIIIPIKNDFCNLILEYIQQSFLHPEWYFSYVRNIITINLLSPKPLDVNYALLNYLTLLEGFQKDKYNSKYYDKIKKHISDVNLYLPDQYVKSFLDEVRKYRNSLAHGNLSVKDSSEYGKLIVLYYFVRNIYWAFIMKSIGLDPNTIKASLTHLDSELYIQPNLCKMYYPDCPYARLLDFTEEAIQKKLENLEKNIKSLPPEWRKNKHLDNYVQNYRSEVESFCDPDKQHLTSIDLPMSSGFTTIWKSNFNSLKFLKEVKAGNIKIDNHDYDLTDFEQAIEELRKAVYEGDEQTNITMSVKYSDWLFELKQHII